MWSINSNLPTRFAIDLPKPAHRSVFSRLSILSWVLQFLLILYPNSNQLNLSFQRFFHISLGWRAGTHVTLSSLFFACHVIFRSFCPTAFQHNWLFFLVKHLKTDWTTGTQEMAGRNSIRLDMPLGQALQEVSLGAVAGQLRVQREMYEKVDTPEAKVHIQNQPQLYQQNPLANQQVFGNLIYGSSWMLQFIFRSNTTETKAGENKTENYWRNPGSRNANSASNRET